jgi:hypothetical protein
MARLSKCRCACVPAEIRAKICAALSRDTSRESDSRAVVLPKANTVIKRQLPTHAELIYIVLVVERIWSARIKQVYDL